MKMRSTFLVGLFALLPAALAGQEVRGRVGLETRGFPIRPRFAEQRAATVSPSMVVAPELLWDVLDGDLQLTFESFLRLDSHDGRRTHFDVRQASALYVSEEWTLFAGLGRVFWGKAESNHLVDIVNQTDGVEDVDGEDKLGQPMVTLTLERSWGAIDLFYLPYFRERTFPGAHARLRGPLPVTDAAVYESGARRWHPDVAARWTSYVGDLDLAVSAFRGTSREPRLLPIADAGGLALQAHYDIIDQIGIEAQWTRGATLWKLEAMTRGGQGDRFAAAVLGVEHTLFGIRESAGDLGLLAEWSVDGRGDSAPYTAFDHDLFLGARWALNDRNDTSVLGGPIIDLKTGELIGFVEAQRRIADRWTIEVEARWFANTEVGGPLSGLSHDDFVTLGVSRHF